MTAHAYEGALPEPVAGDVSTLPNHVFGNRDLMWWGTGFFILIEGFTLSLCVVTYFYLIRKEGAWPPEGTPLPNSIPFVIQSLVMLAGVGAAFVAERAAKKLDQGKLRVALLALSIIGILSLGIRALEFGALNVRWDEHAYGSVIWAIVGFHTTMLLPDVIDGIALAVLSWRGPLRAKYFVAATDNTYYWYFVTASWIITSAILLLTPRFL
jgi:heme/copper-type cytochrome/quinol oxidase subunit 3